MCRLTAPMPQRAFDGAVRQCFDGDCSDSETKYVATISFFTACSFIIRRKVPRKRRPQKITVDDCVQQMSRLEDELPVNLGKYS